MPLGIIFCWLSSDDIYYLEKIEIQLTFIKKENSLFSYTNYYSINEKNEIITPTLDINPPNWLQLLKIMNRGNIINGCTVMINKNVFDHIGVFDETLPYTHDYDLWLRIIKKFNIHYLDQPLLLYRVHKQMGT